MSINIDLAVIKTLIKETTMKTPEFVQAVINDAEVKKASSIKTVTGLVALWEKRELSFGSLKFHLKAVHAAAEKKPVKAPKVKVAKVAKPKAAKAKKPAKAAPVLQIVDRSVNSLPLFRAAA